MSVSCSRCGQEWARDPALEVACPSCQAGVGSPCRRPSEHPCDFHAGRDRLALETVEGYKACPGEGDPLLTAEQGELF